MTRLKASYKEFGPFKGWHIKESRWPNTPVAVLVEPQGGTDKINGRSQRLTDYARLLAAAPKLFFFVSTLRKLAMLRSATSDDEILARVRSTTCARLITSVEGRQ